MQIQMTIVNTVFTILQVNTGYLFSCQRYIIIILVIICTSFLSYCIFTSTCHVIAIFSHYCDTKKNYCAGFLAHAVMEIPKNLFFLCVRGHR